MGHSFGNSDNEDGITGTSSTAVGVHGKSTTWNGVKGDSQDNAGVSGTSEKFVGVWAESKVREHAGIFAKGPKIAGFLVAVSAWRRISDITYSRP